MKAPTPKTPKAFLRRGEGARSGLGTSKSPHPSRKSTPTPPASTTPPPSKKSPPPPPLQESVVQAAAGAVEVAAAPGEKGGSDAGELALQLQLRTEERDFYYNKLLALEAFIDHACRKSGDQHHAFAAHELKSILYASNSVFALPEDAEKQREQQAE